MKGPLFSAFVVASLMVAIAHCFPGLPHRRDSRDQNDKDGVEQVLILPGGSPFSLSHPVIRLPELPSFGDDFDESSEGWNPFGTSFNLWKGSSLQSFFDDMQSFTDRIQEKMATMMTRLMGPGSFGFGGKTPEGGNTTSTTKVINGHVVTINETTYQSSGNNSNVVFRVHVVDVKPVNQTTGGGESTETETDIGGGEEIETLTTQGADNGQNRTPSTSASDAEKTTEKPRSVETVEDLAGNEIPMKNEGGNLNA